MSTIKELNEQMKKALHDARAICDAADGEKRDFTTEERSQVADLLKDAREKKARIKQMQGDEQMRQTILDMGEGVALNENSQKKQNGRSAGPGATMGARFVNSPEYKSWMQQVAPSGVIGESRKGLASPPIEMKDFGLFRQKAVVTGAGATSAGAFVVEEDSGIYEPLGRHPLTLRDLIAVRTTMSDTVEFVRQTAQVTQAAPTPEANVTDYTGATGQVSGEKPEGTMTFERVSEQVKTIAVWIPATKRALSDAMQLRGLIDQELREDLSEELEDQLINGNGVGENFTGLANTANTLSQAFTTDIITTTRKALTYLLVTGKQRPSAWLMHPSDWETIELLKDGQNRYYWGGPINRGPATLWGVPVVQSFFVTQGAAWLGNWQKAVLWDREQATITATDSHADFFIRNMVAILAEMRAAFGVIRPSAFVEVDLEGGS